MKPMNTAPRDGTLIEVCYQGAWYRVEYHDCQWVRDGSDGVDADPSVTDAWAIEDAAAPGHIELGEAEGWRQAE